MLLLYSFCSFSFFLYYVTLSNSNNIKKDTNKCQRYYVRVTIINNNNNKTTGEFE